MPVRDGAPDCLCAKEITPGFLLSLEAVIVDLMGETVYVSIRVLGYFCVDLACLAFPSAVPCVALPYAFGLLADPVLLLHPT